MNKKTSKLYNSISYLILAGIAFLTTCVSPTLIKASEFENPDSSAFRYMGMLMAKGGVPYRDAFDNKGPLMYFIEFVGYILGKKIGLYLVELLFVFSFFLVSYSIVKRFVSGKIAVLTVIAAVSPLGVFYMGNLTEEYSMLFLALGILVFIDFFLFDKDSFWRIFICGTCFGAVLLIRANMAGMWPVFCIYVIVDQLKKNHKLPVKYISEFVLGSAAIIVPFVFWLFSKGALPEFWKDYIVTNFAYAGGAASLKGVLFCCIHFATVSYIEIYVLFLLFIIFKKENIAFNVVYIVFMLFNLYMSCMAGVVYDHYGMILIPSLIYPASVLVKYVLSLDFFKTGKYYVAIFLTLISLVFFVFVYKNLIVFTEQIKNGEKVSTERTEVLNLINEYAGEDDRILVLGYDPQYYIDADRLCSSKFYYSFFYDHYPDGTDAVIEDLNQNLPKVVVCLNASENMFLFENYDKYEKVYQRGVWVLREE